MLGVPDPRTMPPASWSLAAQVKSELAPLTNVKQLNLHVKAIGDPLWNPLWVWFHASQAFVPMGEDDDDEDEHDQQQATAPKGPRLSKITFSLDTWSPGENHLERVAEEPGKWGWYCPEGHCVSTEAGPDMTVREFCARLYTECRVCRPELDSDDEEGWGVGDGDEEDDDVESDFGEEGEGVGEGEVEAVGED
jgi:hypothetical protein